MQSTGGSWWQRRVQQIRRWITQAQISRYQRRQQLNELDDRRAREHVERREAGIKDGYPPV